MGWRKDLSPLAVKNEKATILLILGQKHTEKSKVQTHALGLLGKTLELFISKLNTGKPSMVTHSLQL